MRYVIDLESPDFDLLIVEFRARAVTLLQQKFNFEQTYGRTSHFTTDAAARVRRIDAIVRKLTIAQGQAVPERAVENTAVTPTAACDVDDIYFVAGRSRSDPRYTKAKPK